jgi:ATP-dependent helicase/nuclease subunit A
MMDDASRRQFQAARPEYSTWLYANAGSGKTRVLTNRVARLLLGGVSPEHILCLTYTKAAATEMQNRLFEMLGEWVMLTDQALKQELQKLGVFGDIETGQLARARTLFALAIEAPGGLRIQTIHAFCGGLLRRFPVEAGISPQFREMSETDTTATLQQITADLAAGPQREMYREFLTIFGGQTPSEWLESLPSKRDILAHAPDRAQLLALHGLAPDATDQSLFDESVQPQDRSNLIAAQSILITGSKTDIAKAQVIGAPPDLTPDGLADIAQDLFYGKSGEPSAERTYHPTKKLKDGAFAQLLPWYLNFRERAMTYLDTRASLRAVSTQLIAQTFAVHVLRTYEAHKAKRGLLDFDDLILKTRDLLARDDVRDWVLYRLDGSFNHILIDEAQDTSPAQWNVIQALTSELTSGLGVDPDTEKTVFVVGDEKQSIYSFQGAVPEKFDEMRDAFKTRLDAIGRPFQDSYLEHSFRSSDAILRIVDDTFQPNTDSGIPKGANHIAFNDSLPGRVDLWPLVEDGPKDDKRDWYDPVDSTPAKNPNIVLSEHIARFIRETIDAGTQLPLRGKDGSVSARPVHEGDFLILVQGRSGIFPHVIRACKNENLATAGADRLIVGVHLAVKDMIALLKTLVTPEDDISLATVLRSPLCGWSEEDLFNLAHDRGKMFLWQRLREAYPQAPATLFLYDLMAQSDFLRPFDLMSRILIKHNKMKAFVNRLGTECEDTLGALQQLALDYEARDVPSLSGFITWMEQVDSSIKRQSNPENNEVRIMTVHGAKGLEAPIVILAETKSKKNNKGTSQVFMATAQNQPIWIRSKDDRLSPLETQLKASKAHAEAQEKDRQLYVAMTRAENWLIVTGAGKPGDHDPFWYGRCKQALLQNGIEIETPTGVGLRYAHGTWPAPADTPAASVQTREATPAARLDEAPVPANYAPFRTMAPSQLGGAKALASAAGLDEASATALGSAVHLLLEHWPLSPPSSWDALAQNLLSGVDPQISAQATKHVRTALAHPSAAFLTQPDLLREVPVTAAIFGPTAPKLYGIIDALWIEDQTIHIVDFKSNAEVPNTAETCPNGILRQMGAYGRALETLYPQHTIAIKLFWTAGPCLMDIPAALWQDAIEEATLENFAHGSQP